MTVIPQISDLPTTADPENFDERADDAWTALQAAIDAFNQAFAELAAGVAPEGTAGATGVDVLEATTQAEGRAAIGVGIRGHLAGLALSAAGSTGTFGIQFGEAADDSNTGLMALTSGITKTTSAWASGSGNGALDAGTIANNTWYHVWLIKNASTGAVDVLISASATSPTMPSGYTLKRRIGSMKTDGSAQWVKFSQRGDEFLWDAPVADVASATIGTSAASQTLSVPTGVKVDALIRVGYFGASGQTYLLISALDVADAAASLTTANVDHNTSGSSVTRRELRVRTNTSGQVRARSGTAGGTLSIGTVGWIDRRGRDD